MVKTRKNLNKRVYQQLVNKHKEYPTKLEEKWSLILGDNNFKLSDNFNILQEFVKDNSIKNIQFKILHRILPTNRLLYKMKIINYNCCYICSTYIETLDHMFFECMEIRNIWLRLFDDLSLKEKFENLEVNKNNILFGFRNDVNDVSGLNVFFILVKKYLFECKQFERKVSYDGVKNYLIYQCKIQKSVSKNANREWGFLDAWL